MTTPPKNCTHYLITIAKLVEAIQMLERLPLPHSPAVTQAIKNDNETIRQLELEYAACMK